MTEQPVSAGQTNPAASVARRPPFGISLRKSGLGLDIRSLALFRIVLGAVVFAEVFSRWLTFDAFYSTHGILPLADFPDRISVPRHFSAFLWVDSNLWSHGLFALLLLSALTLTLGWYSRTSAFVCWVLLVSLNFRNELFLHSADPLCQLLLLWATLLPIGSYWSLDARRKPRACAAPAIFLSPAAVALQLQVLVVYFSTGLFKLGYENWRNGTHLENTMLRTEYGTPFGLFFYEHFQWLLPWLSWGVLIIQVPVALLLLVPWRFGKLRCAVLAVFVGLQVGMGTMLYVGYFPLVAIAALVPLLPPWFWARVRSADKEGRDKTLAIAGEGASITAQGRVVVGLAALVMMLLVNLNDHVHFASPSFRALERHTALTQEWMMFAAPEYNAGWFLAVAELADGSEVNLMREGQPVDYTVPAVPSADFPDYRWRIILANRLRYPHWGQARFGVARYIGESWNRRVTTPERKVVSVKLVEMRFDVRQGPDTAEPLILVAVDIDPTD